MKKTLIFLAFFIIQASAKTVIENDRWLSPQEIQGIPPIYWHVLATGSIRQHPFALIQTMNHQVALVYTHQTIGESIVKHIYEDHVLLVNAQHQKTILWQQ